MCTELMMRTHGGDLFVHIRSLSHSTAMAKNTLVTGPMVKDHPRTSAGFVCNK